MRNLRGPTHKIRGSYITLSGNVTAKAETHLRSDGSLIFRVPLYGEIEYRDLVLVLQQWEQEYRWTGCCSLGDPLQVYRDTCANL